MRKRRLVLIMSLALVAMLTSVGVVVAQEPGMNKAFWSLIGNAGTDPSTNFLGTTDNQALVVKTNGMEAVRIDTSGNVGIGTPNPVAALHVENSDGTTMRISGTDPDANVFLQLLEFDNKNGIELQYEGTGPGGGALHFNNFGISNIMTMRRTGHVGIGTPNPVAALHVENSDGTTMRISGTDPDANVFLQLLEFDNKNGIELQYDGTGGGALLINNFGVSTILTIRRTGVGGNVGVGMTDPQSALQVSGYTQLDLTTGAPPAADCDQATERGRMKVDSGAGLLYVCADSGWVAK